MGMRGLKIVSLFGVHGAKKTDFGIMSRVVIADCEHRTRSLEVQSKGNPLRPGVGVCHGFVEHLALQFLFLAR